MATPQSESEQPGAAAWRVIEPYWDNVSICDGPFVFLDNFELLPEPARHLFAIWWCDSEVCNGGFHQFFSNSTGVLAPESLEGFRATGLNTIADLLENALQKFGEPYPRDREARQAALQELLLPGEKREEWDPFSKLDDRYYAAKERGSFYGRLDEFARRHG